jgi:hypothetical protein
MEISPAVELAQNPLLADVASEEEGMRETLQFLVNLLHQYLHSFRGKRENSFLWANRAHVGKYATDISSTPPKTTNNQTTYKSYMMIDRRKLQC